MLLAKRRSYSGSRLQLHSARCVSHLSAHRLAARSYCRVSTIIYAQTRRSHLFPIVIIAGSLISMMDLISSAAMSALQN